VPYQNGMVRGCKGFEEHPQKVWEEEEEMKKGCWVGCVAMVKFGLGRTAL